MSRKHGHTGSPTYISWIEMRKRCYNPRVIRYPLYGAKGITVCDRWLNSFENFLADMGVKPTGFSLDRVDNNGNYCPENCRWADNKTQSNNKSTNVLIELEGRILNAQQWSEETGISAKVIRQRLHRDRLPPEQILKAVRKRGER